MTMTEKHEAGPAENRAGQEIVQNNEMILPAAVDIVRCSECHRPLKAETSVRLELGPVCRAAVAA